MRLKNMSPMEFVRQQDEALANENYQKYIQLISVQTHWLYHNNHKCTVVINEKEAHKIQQLMQSKIDMLKENNEKLERFISNGLEFGYILKPDASDSSLEIIDKILN